jgi:hypothetical protein
MSLPATSQLLTCVIPEAVIYSLDAPNDERKYRSKHVEQTKNNKLSYTVASCWSFSYIILTYFMSSNFVPNIVPFVK